MVGRLIKTNFVHNCLGSVVYMVYLFLKINLYTHRSSRLAVECINYYANIVKLFCGVLIIIKKIIILYIETNLRRC